MNTSDKIKQLLNERGWSVYRLAQESGISQSTLSNMFIRKNDPSIGTLDEICKAFGITLSQFFANDEESVVLTKEQREMLEKWSSLTSEQKKALLNLLR